MSKLLLAAVLAAGLLAAPLPTLVHTAAAQAAAEKKPMAKKPPTAAQLAERDRIRKCGAEWKALKASGKRPKGMKWPQYWSECNKRLKGV